MAKKRKLEYHVGHTKKANAYKKTLILLGEEPGE
jgi:hypothetical protein